MKCSLGPESNAGDGVDPGQVGGSPGESGRVAKSTAIARDKGHESNQSPGTSLTGGHGSTRISSAGSLDQGRPALATDNAGNHDGGAVDA